MHGRLATMLFHWSSGCLHLIRLFWSWCLWPIWSWWMVSNCFELHLHKATWNRTVRTVSIIAHAASLDAQLRATVHDLLLTIMQLHLRVWAVLTHCDWNYQFGRCSIGFKSAVLTVFWKRTQVEMGLKHCCIVMVFIPGLHQNMFQTTCTVWILVRVLLETSSSLQWLTDVCGKVQSV